MPRTLQEIFDHGDELARRFADHEPDPEHTHDADALAKGPRAGACPVGSRADPSAAVSAARDDGHSWAATCAMLGTSGEVARQREAVGPSFAVAWSWAAVESIPTSVAMCFVEG